MIRVGHVIDELRKLPAKSVHCCVTSPPYWALRNYGTDPQTWPDGWRGELGSEPTIKLFVEHIVAVFAEVWLVLRDDGVLWFNMGDSFAASGMGGNPEDSTHRKQSTNHGSLTPPGHRKPPDGLKPKDLCGIPWRCAFALQEAGWYLRSDIPWVKRSAMPESVNDRPAKALEYVFLLTKSQRYFFDMEAVRRKGSGVSGGACFGAQTYDAGRNFRNADLWFESVSRDGLCGIGDELVGLDATPEAFSGAHFATFPRRLIEPMIKAGTSEKGCCAECGKHFMRIKKPDADYESALDRARDGHDWYQRRGSGDGNEKCIGKVSNRQGGISAKYETLGWQPSCSCNAACIPCTVLDPFLGSGTTALVSEALGRSWIGVELNEQYAEIARKRIVAGYEPPKQAKPLKAQLTLISGDTV